MISYKHSTDSLFLTAPSPSTQPSSTSIQGQIKFHIDINRSSCTFRSPQSCLNSDSRSFRLSQDYKIPEINSANKNELRIKTDSSEVGKHFQYLLINQCDLLETQITEQELYQIYLQSQELVIDELTQTDHFELKFAEFVEALARAAELISPSSPYVKEKDIPLHVRKSLALYIKFEGLLYKMFHKLRGKLIQLGFGGLEQTVVNNTILKSWQIKKRGINLEFNDATDSESDSDGEQKKKTVIVDPEKIIDQILFSEKIEQQKQEKEVKARGDEKRRTVKFSQPFNSMRFISDADEQQKKIEEQLIENGSPLTRMRLQLRRNTLRQFDFELQEGVDFIYDSIKEK